MFGLIEGYIGIKLLEKIFSSSDKVDELKRGDVIYVDRGVYKHFGVYSGNDNVIHYTKDEGGCLDGTIRETSLRKFLENENKCFVCNFDEDGNRESVSQFDASSGVWRQPLYPRERIFRKLYSPEETVSRARNCIGKKGYNLVCHNCEHFAIWCKTGVSESKQVDEILDFVTQSNIPLNVTY